MLNEISPDQMYGTDQFSWICAEITPSDLSCQRESSGP